MLPLKLAGAICAIGVLWIAEVLNRLPQDIDEFRSADSHLDRLVIGIIWAITIGMLAFISIPFFRAVRYIWGLM
ncbi:MAG: hypothetical protein ABFD69_16195 [Candidatus Sumerlaeia bacterium]